MNSRCPKIVLSSFVLLWATTACAKTQITEPEVTELEARVPEAPQLLSDEPVELAAEVNPIEAAEALAALLGNLKTLKTQFSQTTLDSRGQMLQALEGEMAVQQPNRFYWQTNEPFAQVIVSNGEKVWQYDEDLEQVVIQSMDARLSQTPALIFGGQVDELAERYDIEKQNLNDTQDVYTLRPKSADSLFQTLRIAFSQDSPVYMQLQDSLGQRVSLEFKELEKNPELDSALFEFVPPEGVDILTQD